ncbi:MAG: Uma2 family endonuclease [Acidobacteria bacterium]|nr:Uma2 family endonuclease [Acidobacteriota bacterium]
MTPALTAVSLEDYLSREEFEKCEWVDGEIVERGMGTGNHSWLGVMFGAALVGYFGPSRPGHVGVELHCRLVINGRVRYRLPDIAVVLNQDLRKVHHLEGAPDIAIEVRSPDQTVASQLRKCREYLECGGQAALLVVPEESALYVQEGEQPLRVLISPEQLTLEAILPGFTLDLATLFA